MEPIQRGRSQQQQTTAEEGRNLRGTVWLHPLHCLPSWPCSAVPSSWLPSSGSSFCCRYAQAAPLQAGGPNCPLCIQRRRGCGWASVLASAKGGRGRHGYATRGSPLCGGMRTWSPTSLNQTVKKWTVTARGLLSSRRRARSSWPYVCCRGVSQRDILRQHLDLTVRIREGESHRLRQTQNLGLTAPSAACPPSFACFLCVYLHLLIYLIWLRLMSNVFMHFTNTRCPTTQTSGWKYQPKPPKPWILQFP